MYCESTAYRFPVTHDCVDIQRINLDSVASPSHPLGGDDRAATSEERVEHYVAACGAIKDRVCDQCDGFHGRMKCKQVSFVASATKRVGAGIVPAIASVATKLTELDVVSVRSASILVHENQLVLAPVQRAHTGLVFDPHGQILQLGICVGTSGQELPKVTPVDTEVV